MLNLTYSYPQYMYYVHARLKRFPNITNILFLCTYSQTVIAPLLVFFR